jgi:hypothetical protein
MWNLEWCKSMEVRVSDCCLMTTQQFFSYIMVIFQYDDEVRFVLDLHAIMLYLRLLLQYLKCSTLPNKYAWSINVESGMVYGDCRMVYGGWEIGCCMLTGDMFFAVEEVYLNCDCRNTDA